MRVVYRAAGRLRYSLCRLASHPRPLGQRQPAVHLPKADALCAAVRVVENDAGQDGPLNDAIRAHAWLTMARDSSIRLKHGMSHSVR